MKRLLYSRPIIELRPATYLDYQTAHDINVGP